MIKLLRINYKLLKNKVQIINLGLIFKTSATECW